MSSPRRTLGFVPLAAALGALALTGTAALFAGGSAVAQPAPVEWVRNGDFGSPLTNGWTCNGDVARLNQAVEGRPSEHDRAGCSQKVWVVPGTTYEFSAYVSGAYAFAGISGTGTGSGEVSLWATGSNGSGLRKTVAIGNVQEVTVHFHGWYGQAPYQISRISLIGPRYPDPCATVTPSPDPTGTPTCLPPPVAPPGIPDTPRPSRSR
ncbi:hypothetical protein [Streptomyces albipurpureus]|uniref:Uncharacterized protein n=1 Tax=Streptomyces albipurpureus TaxID=2897419 RepID=A0ABT0UGH6_9ACTN|nr:hypothetical protein [Streptomyces sp. CWNU-1]MCM2387185.1 hypothetical protein [Streptomyces sp. CWNU-1]